jgi:hypothetical protein
MTLKVQTRAYTATFRTSLRTAKAALLYADEVFVEYYPWADPRADATHMPVDVAIMADLEPAYRRGLVELRADGLVAAIMAHGKRLEEEAVAVSVPRNEIEPFEPSSTQ